MGDSIKDEILMTILLKKIPEETGSRDVFGRKTRKGDKNKEYFFEIKAVAGVFF